MRMYTDIVEIYSDQTNAAVVRHPSRKFPGVLVQGDSLHALCAQADSVCIDAKRLLSTDEYEELDDLRNKLWGYLNHYKSVLAEHDMSLPFSEQNSR